MANIFGALDVANHIQQQGEVGRQQGERSYLGRLMGQAIEAPPEQRTGLFALMARTSPDVALAAESHFTNRDAAQQERMAAELRNRAGILRQLPPEQRAIGWQRMAPDVAKLTNMPELANMPYDPATFDPVLDQIAGIGASEPKVLSPGSALYDSSGRLIAQNEYQTPANAQIVAVPDGLGGTVSMMFDPRTRQLSDLPLGGAQAPAGAPQGGSVAASPTDALGVLSGISALSNVPGVQTTSLHRDPANNARVGGVANSQHMQGTAGDFVVPAAIKPAFMAQARALGFEAIDEGDHVHVELPPGARGAGGQMPRMGYNPPKPSADGAPSGYRYRPDGSLEHIPGGPADPANKPQAADKPIPVGALRLQLDATEALSVAEGLDDQLNKYATMIGSGTLDLGPVDNVVSAARNWAGASSDNSRNYADFRANLEKMRNDSLRLNKGVQTEGDAQRAWNELVASINDPATVVQRLKTIRELNRRAIQLQQDKLRAIEQNYQGRDAAPEDDISDLLQLYGDSI